MDIIIGGGVTGLSYALFTSNKSLILEAEPEIGGYCKTTKREKILTGRIQPYGDKTFTDCIITNQTELEENIIEFIPTKIPDPEGNKEIPNINDDLVTNTLQIDFGLHSLIALTGINKVLKVENHNDNYLIYHDGIKGKKNTYVAVLVQKIIGGFPILEFNPPKI